MKKFLVVALSVLMLVALFIPAMADDAPKFTTTVSANKVKRGETVTVTVSVDKTVNGRGFALDYSAIAGAGAKFEYVSADYSATIKAGSMMVFPHQVDQFGGTQAANMAAAPFDVVGEVFTLTVKAKEDADFGSYNFEIAVKVDAVSAATAGASVEIYHDCVPATDYSKDTTHHWKGCTVSGCTVAPAKEEHKYDNACDTICNVCNEERVITHDFTKTLKNDTHHWTVCNVCGVEKENSRVAHSGGTATCTAKAVCSCGQAYGSTLPHTEDPTPVLVSPADCANAAVYKKVCADCGTQIGATFPVGSPDASLHSGGQANCQNRANCQHCGQPYGALDPDVHVGNTRVDKNADQHWTECESCGEEIANTRVAHSGGAATCKDKAVCSCGQAYGSVDPNAHTGNTRVAKNADEHWTECESCNAEIANTRVAHSGGTATCKDKAVCSCGQAYGDVDLTKHKGGKANCANKAICEVCGDPYGAIDLNVHTGNVNVAPAEPATCKKEGKTEEISCKDCGAVLTPATPVEKEPHVIKTWTVTKPASETEEGEKKGNCETCGDEFTVKTEKLVSALKPENIVGEDAAPIEGAKVEGVDGTKLPENSAAGMVESAPEQLGEIAEEMKSEIDSIPEAKGKDLLAATVVAIVNNDTYVDAATGDTIIDATANDQLPGVVKVTAPINADLTNYENLVVLGVNEDGEVTKLDATVAGGMVVYNADEPISAIMVLGTQKVAPNPNVPQNGDGSEVILFASLALVSLLTLGAIFVSKRAKASK